MPPAYIAGIDAGSTTWKAVIIDTSGNVIGTLKELTTPRMEEQSEKGFSALLSGCGIKRDSVGEIVATGYGRKRVSFATKVITEISCHAIAAYRKIEGVRTVLDVGGQDSKAIKIGKNGKVENFVMNDKCSAGTGRFLEVSAKTLGVPLEAIGKKAIEHDPAAISSTCTVFAESEIISLVASGVPVDDIVSGLHHSLCERLCALLYQVSWEQPLAMTGGVALNEGMVYVLEKALSTRLLVPPEPQIMGAYGAAVSALPED